MSKKDNSLLGMALFLGLMFVVAAGHNQIIDFTVNYIGKEAAFVLLGGLVMYAWAFSDPIIGWFLNLKVATKEDDPQ